MKISITGRHTKLSDALRTYADKKLSKLDRHNDLVTTADVVMTVEGERNVVEVIAHLKGGKPRVAKAEHDDMYAALDLLVEKIDRQLVRHKEKVKIAPKHAGRGLGEAIDEASQAREAQDEEE